MTLQPKWSTPSRKAILAKLLPISGWQIDLITGEVYNPEYEAKANGLDVIVEVTEYYREPVPVPKSVSETGYVMAKKPVKVFREIHIVGLIDDWKADDRQQAKLDWETERKAIHSLGERSYREGRFGSISRDIFHDSQPLFYLEALGMSAVTLTPFAVVKIGSSWMRLFVDLGESLRGVSKSKRRKAIRYGKPLGKEVNARIHEVVWLAVKHYLCH